MKPTQGRKFFGKTWRVVKETKREGPVVVDGVRGKRNCGYFREAMVWRGMKLEGG